MDQCAIRPVTVRPSQFFQHIRVSQLHNSTWNPFSCWFKNYTTTWNYNIFIFILKVLWPTTKALAIPYPCAELSEPVSEQVSLVDEGQYWLTVTPVLNFCIFNTSEHIKPLQPVGQAAEFRFEYTPQGPYVWRATTNNRTTWKISNLLKYLSQCKVLKELDQFNFSKSLRLTEILAKCNGWFLQQSEWFCSIFVVWEAPVSLKLCIEVILHRAET